jgi:hypothetical protein
LRKLIEHLRARRPELMRMSLVVAASALCAFAQNGQGSGDISQPLSQYQTLGQVILEIFFIVAVIAFVGVLIWGALTLGSNRPRGIAMIGGGLAGALLCGLAVVIVSTLTGSQVQTGSLGMLLLPHGWL